MKKLLIHTYEDEDKQYKYKFVSVWLAGFVFCAIVWFFVILLIPKSHAYNIDTVCMSQCIAQNPLGSDYVCRQICTVR